MVSLVLNLVHSHPAGHKVRRRQLVGEAKLRRGAKRKHHGTAGVKSEGTNATSGH